MSCRLVSFAVYIVSCTIKNILIEHIKLNIGGVLYNNN